MQQTKEEKVHHVFETISHDYDKMNSVISFQTTFKMAFRYNETNECSKRQSTALDVCCGTADWTIALAEAVGPKGKVTGT